MTGDLLCIMPAVSPACCPFDCRPWCYREVRVAEFGPKPKHIPKFWKVEAVSPAEAAKVSAFLDYLNRPSASLGGRKRTALVLGAAGGKPEYGLIAGSDGRGGMAPIMYCLRDAQ